MEISKNTKIVVITGGVLSGLGKGVLTASIGSLYTQSEKMVCIKCDGYLNADPGTMNPIEHGEVFVLNDGGEVDMDFGHYERFMGVEAKRSWNITMGKVYQQILEDERKGKYLGKTVQLIPHATDEIKHKIYSVIAENDASLAFVEVGGTIGDMENELFIESMRQIRSELGMQRLLFVHLTYVPFIEGSRELKSKPTQASVKVLNQAGIYPDLIICRTPMQLSHEVQKKISLYCNVPEDAVFSNKDLNSIYYLPKHLEAQNITDIIDQKLGIKSQGLSPADLQFLESLQKLEELEKQGKTLWLKVAVFGKYTGLEDSYASIREALLHARVNLYLQKEIALSVEIVFEDATLYANNKALNDFAKTPTVETKNLQQQEIVVKNGYDAVIVPGGFGVRGLDGKIAVVKYARENNIPFLGICLGMQVAVIEFARNVCGFADADTTEHYKDKKKSNPLYPVIDLLPGQSEAIYKGGSMRLGSHVVLLREASLVRRLFAKDRINERFRHRYEVNERFVEEIEKKGMKFTGIAKNNSIKQICEIPENEFFLCTQSHPELSSTPRAPSAFFLGLLNAAYEIKCNTDNQG